jgi:hypothetical protein
MFLFPWGPRVWSSWFSRVFAGFRPGFAHSLAPEVLLFESSRFEGGVCVVVARAEGERRKWSRLPLAIPVFVRSRDEKGKEFLEFATALNVSAGGMLVAIRRILPASAQIELEIPSAPVVAVALLPRASRNLRAKALHTRPVRGYCLLGLKFSRPLLSSDSSRGIKRKVVSPL